MGRTAPFEPCEVPSALHARPVLGVLLLECALTDRSHCSEIHHPPVNYRPLAPVMGSLVSPVDRVHGHPEPRARPAGIGDVKARAGDDRRPRTIGQVVEDDLVPSVGGVPHHGKPDSPVTPRRDLPLERVGPWRWLDHEVLARAMPLPLQGAPLRAYRDQGYPPSHAPLARTVRARCHGR